MIDSKTIEEVGISARPLHFKSLLQKSLPIQWIELVADNYLDTSHSTFALIQVLREKYPLTLHSLNLSIGSTDPFNKKYLKKLKRLKIKLKPLFISDHLCWTSKGNHYFHDLLPLPYTEEIAKYLIQRIRFLQDFFEDFIVLENISSYFSYKISKMSEADFFKIILEESNCKLLLDINNLYVNCKNNESTSSSNDSNHFNGFNDFLKKIPKDSIRQVHLAGFTHKGHYLIDTHSKPVAEDVWVLYKKTLEHYGVLPTCIEWDKNIPSLKGLMREVEKARSIYLEIK